MMGSHDFNFDTADRVELLEQQLVYLKEEKEFLIDVNKGCYGKDRKEAFKDKHRAVEVSLEILAKTQYLSKLKEALLIDKEYVEKEYTDLKLDELKESADKIRYKLDKHTKNHIAFLEQELEIYIEEKNTAIQNEESTDPYNEAIVFFAGGIKEIIAAHTKK